MTMSPSTSPTFVPTTSIPVPKVCVGGTQHRAPNSTSVLRALASMISFKGKLKKTKKASIGRGKYKQWQGVTVAYYKKCIAIAATHETILHARACGGGMVCVTVPARTMKKVVVGGIGLKINVVVWTSAMCGPIKTTSVHSELLESRYGQLAVDKTENWCTPVSSTGKFVCNACGRQFTNEHELWHHGTVPAPVVRLKGRFPPQPLRRGPPPHYYAQGSIANPRAAKFAQEYIKNKLVRHRN